MALSINMNSKQLKNLEHEGFAHGSQNGSSENALLEIDAYANQEKADEQHKYVEQTKKLEGKLEHLERISPAAEARWRDTQQIFGEHAPPVVLPVGLVFGGVFALFAEAVMLAPSLDPYGVVNPVSQYVFAFGIAFASSIFFHYAFEAAQIEDLTPVRRLLVWCFGAGAVCALTFFGIVRGRQIAFVGELSHNPVGEFLGRYPILSSIVFVCLTLGFPIAAAVATTSGLERVGSWKTFLSAKRNFDQVTQELPKIKKQLESEKEKLSHQIKSLDERRTRWRHDYLVHHEKGVIFGARQMPLWMVWLKALSITLLFVGLAWVYWRIGLPFSIGVFVLLWIGFYYERMHPSPAQQFKHQNIQFRSGGATTGQSQTKAEK